MKLFRIMWKILFWNESKDFLLAFLKEKLKEFHSYQKIGLPVNFNWCITFMVLLSENRKAVFLKYDDSTLAFNEPKISGEDYLD